VLRGIGASLMPDGWTDLARRAGAAVYHFNPRERLPQWLIHRSGPMTPATQAFVDTTCRPGADAATPLHTSSSHFTQGPLV
jgi:hypothetical protein